MAVVSEPGVCRSDVLPKLTGWPNMVAPHNQRQHAFEQALSIGLLAFAASALLVGLKLLFVKAFAMPALDFGGLAPQMLSLMQSLFLAPGFLATIAIGIALLGSLSEKLPVGSSVAAIVTASWSGVLCLHSVSPLISGAAVSAPVPLVIGVPALVGASVLVAQRRFLVQGETVFAGTIPATFVCHSLVSLLFDTGLTAAFPVDWTFIRREPLVAGRFAVAIYLSFALPLFVAAAALSRRPLRRACVVIAVPAAVGSAWIIVMPDHILGSLIALPPLVQFRFGLEIMAVLLASLAVRAVIGAGRIQAFLGALLVISSYCVALMPVTAKAALFSPGMAIDAAARRFYSNLLDGDGDGASVFLGQTDCNDRDFSVRPGRSDIPQNGIDENCLEGDLQTADSPPDRWELDPRRPVDQRIILVTVDTLRSDMVFGTPPVMHRLNAFAQRHAGFPSTYSLGSLTAVGLLTLLYPDELLEMYMRGHTGLLVYLKQAGFTTYCVYPSYRIASSRIPAAVFEDCQIVDIVAGEDRSRTPYGEEVLSEGFRHLQRSRGNTFIWIQLDDLHDYVS